MTEEIKKTTEYSLFKRMKGNRPILRAHVNNLIQSINKINLLSTNPIKVNEKMEVIDGQNRLEAAKKLRVPIYYMVSMGGNLQDVQILNTYVEKWSMMNYIDSYVEQGNQNYILLKDYIQTYDLPPVMAAQILSGMKMTGRDLGEIRSNLRDGSFTVTALKQAEERGKIINLCAQYTEYLVYKSREFIAALELVLNQVLWEDLYEKMQQANTKIPRRANKRDYVRELEVIFNYHRQKNLVRFS